MCRFSWSPPGEKKIIIFFAGESLCLRGGPVNSERDLLRHGPDGPILPAVARIGGHILLSRRAFVQERGGVAWERVRSPARRRSQGAAAHAARHHHLYLPAQ